MMARTHVPIGVATAIVVSKAMNIELGAYYLIAAAIGSTLPDIDHPQGKLNQKILLVNSKIGKIITYIFLAYLALDLYIKNSNMTFLIYLMPVLIMIALSKHRGITHSLLGSAIMIYVAFKLEPMMNMRGIAIGFTVGYLMHIVADCFTPEGVKLFFPYRRNYRFPITIVTNGFIENFLCLGSLMFCIYLYIGN